MWLRRVVALLARQEGEIVYDGGFAGQDKAMSAALFGDLVNDCL